jgi:hypothetical protein
VDTEKKVAGYCRIERRQRGHGLPLSQTPASIPGPVPVCRSLIETASAICRLIAVLCV